MDGAYTEELVHIYIWAVSVLPIVCTLAFLWRLERRARQADNYSLPIRLKTILVVAAMVPLGTVAASKISWLFAVGYFIASCAFAVAFMYDIQTDKLSKAGFFVSYYVSVGALLTLVAIAVVPRISQVWPYQTLFRRAVDKPTQAAPSVNTAFIRSSLESIQRSMSASVKDIQREELRVRMATTTLIAEVDRQNKVIRELSGQRDLMLKEIARERLVSSLTHEQAEAIRSSLSRGKYLDYVIGFVLGIVSSVVASFALRLIGERGVTL